MCAFLPKYAKKMQKFFKKILKSGKVFINRKTLPTKC